MTPAQQQGINPKALTWTIGVHILLFLLFFLWKYTIPATPIPQEMGMEVNLGTSDNGSGTDQPMSVEDPSNEVAMQHSSAAAQSNAVHDMMESADANAPVVATTANKTAQANTTNPTTHSNKNTQQADAVKAKQQQAPKYVYNGSNGKGGNGAVQNMPGTNEGNTTGPGDRGVPNGTPGAINYTGSPGNGNGGINHTLTGRSISPDRFEASFREGGTVKIKVTVDRNGNIVSKYVASSPSPELSRIALEKLGQARFSPSTEASPQQFGYVTIVFKAR